MYDQKRQRLVEDFRFFYYYDNNGNLSAKVSKTSSEVTNFIHNTQNQLIGIESFDGQTKTKEVRYVYDALGRRVQKQIADLVNAANSHKRSFGYDGQDLLFEFNESNELLATYTHSGLRMDDILAADFTSKAIDAKRSKNDGSYFYLKDALGSVKEITDSQGNIVQQYAYSAFGELVSVRDAGGVDIKSDPNIAPYFTYTAREYDAESGLYYYRARYYDAAIGRFLQVDPHPGETVNPITVANKYVYTLNNPINLVDPSGLFGVFEAVAFGAVLGLTDPFGIVSKTSDFTKRNRNKIIGASLVFAGAIVAAGSGGAALPLGTAIAGAGIGIINTNNDASLLELAQNAFIGGAIGVAVVVVPGGILAKAAAGGVTGILTSSLMGRNSEKNISSGVYGLTAGGITAAAASIPTGGSFGGNTGGNENICWCGGRLIPK